MQVFRVPYDMKREEKIFGGYLSLRQVSYLLLATVPLSLFPTSLPLFIKIMLVGIISTFFVLCCFFKIGEQNFDKFFFFAIKYLFRKKVYVYSRRCD